MLGSQGDVTEALMPVHGFTERMLARAGLMAIRHEVIKARTKSIKIGKVRITDSGRRVLEG